MAFTKINKSGRQQSYRNNTIFALVGVVCLLVVANLFKYGDVAKESILKNKDFIDVLSKILGSAALVVGAIASYYRFFRGRTFAARADLKLEVAVYRTEEVFNLHVINLEVANIGPVPIWEPGLKLMFIYTEQTELKNTPLTIRGILLTRRPRQTTPP